MHITNSKLIDNKSSKILEFLQDLKDKDTYQKAKKLQNNHNKNTTNNLEI